MRIRVGEYIHEVKEVQVREDDILIGVFHFKTGKRTQEIGKQILEKGYADLTDFDFKSL